MATKGMNLFKGKETYGEELKEAKAIKSGKLTPQQYAKGEKSEDMKKANPFAKKRKFADGGEITEMMPSAKPEGGRFDEDTYSRARRFVESQGKKEETKTAVKKARKVEVDPTAGEAKEGKAAQRAADMMGDAPAKRPGMMSRLRADSAMREKALKRKREETPDLSMRDESTSNPMGKNFGAGRVNPKTLMPYEKGGKVAKYASGGSIDGCAQRGKTRGKMR